MKYYGGDMQVLVDGHIHNIREDVIKEIFRQIAIQDGKNILENYVDAIRVDINSITDNQFAEYTNEVEKEMLCETGDIEWKVMERMFGVKEGW